MSDLLTYVEKLPKLPAENPPLLILLHGYGSNELDLFSFADELPETLVIVSLRAPYEMGHGGPRRRRRPARRSSTWRLGWRRRRRPRPRRCRPPGRGRKGAGRPGGGDPWRATGQIGSAE